MLNAGTGDLYDKIDYKTEQRTINTIVSGFTFVANWAFKYFEKQQSGNLAATNSIAGLR